jgi:hypothetical protein
MVATISPQTQAENPLSDVLIEKISQLSPSQQQEVLQTLSNFFSTKNNLKRLFGTKLPSESLNYPPKLSSNSPLIPQKTSNHLSHTERPKNEINFCRYFILGKF